MVLIAVDGAVRSQPFGIAKYVTPSFDTSTVTVRTNVPLDWIHTQSNHDSTRACPKSIVSGVCPFAVKTGEPMSCSRLSIIYGDS